MADLFYLIPTGILAVYTVAAVLPAIILMRYIYRHDRIEKEPGILLVQLLLAGVLSAFAAIILENIGSRLLIVFVDTESVLFYVLFAFLVVAVSEEGAKLFFLKRKSWQEPNFNYMFDGIVYSVFTSLGFAAFENIKYVFSYGLSTAVLRALTAVPAHMAFAVFMGIFYGRAKLCANRGDTAGAKWNLIMGFLSAVVLHGFYDACCMIGTSLTMAIFLGFVVLMYFVVMRIVKKASWEDHPL